MMRAQRQTEIRDTAYGYGWDNEEGDSFKKTWVSTVG